MGEALRAYLGRRGYLQGIEDRRVLIEWPEIVGPALARMSRPLKIEREVLLIAVESATEADHIQYLAPRLLQKVLERLPGSHIRSIRVLHRPRGGLN